MNAIANKNSEKVPLPKKYVHVEQTFTFFTTADDSQV